MTMDVHLTDARVEELNEDYIFKWSIIEFISNFLVIIFFSYIGGLFFVLFIELRFNINLSLCFSFLTHYIFPIIFMIIMILRKRIINHLINKANRNEDLGSLYNHQTKLISTQVLLVAYLLTIIYLNKMYSNIIMDNSLVLMFSITVLFMPIYFTFGTILTEAGFIFIEFGELNRNIHSFGKRQRWLTKICIRVSDTFKKGNIMVNKDKLRYQFNVQMRNSVNMKSKINEMKNWFLSEDKNDDIFTIFEKIWPTVMKKQYSRLIWHQRIDAFIPYKYVKLLVGIILIIVARQNPELIVDIISKVISG